MYHYTTGPEISETVHQNKRVPLHSICHSYKKLSIRSIKKNSDLKLNSGMDVGISKDSENLHNIATNMPWNRWVGITHSEGHLLVLNEEIKVHHYVSVYCRNS